ncbi:MAG: DUF2079 domain-containing protein [Anaerolineales bacterium]|nr:DUF2079 domain-containing protein [Anaerolineales bacterium]
MAGLIWFYIATFVIVPAHAAEVYGAAESTYFQRYGALGNSSTDILKSVVTRPDLVVQIASEPARVAYLAGLLVIFAWLPLLGLEIVLLALPLLLANLLSAYPAQYYGEFHYSAPLVAYFGVAAVYGMGRMWRFLARRFERSSSSFQHLPARNRADGGSSAGAKRPHGAVASPHCRSGHLGAGVVSRQLSPLWTRAIGRSLRSDANCGASPPVGSLHRADSRGCGRDRHRRRPSACESSPLYLSVPAWPRRTNARDLGAA